MVNLRTMTNCRLAHHLAKRFEYFLVNLRLQIARARSHKNPCISNQMKAHFHPAIYYPHKIISHTLFKKYYLKTRNIKKCTWNYLNQVKFDRRSLHLQRKQIHLKFYWLEAQ